MFTKEYSLGKCCQRPISGMPKDPGKIVRDVLCFSRWVCPTNCIPHSYSFDRDVSAREAKLNVLVSVLVI